MAESSVALSEVPSTITSLEAEGPAKECFVGIILGTRADEVDVEDPTSPVVCNTCNKSVDRDICSRVGKNRLSAKATATWRCNPCNALKARMNRLMDKRQALATDWQMLPDDAKRDFIERSHLLSGEELLQGMAAEIQLSKELVSSMHNTNLGKFFPLSVYRSKGYSDEHIQHIEKTAEKKFSVGLNDWTYQVMIESSGSRDEEVVRNLAKYTPGKTKRSQPNDPQPSAEDAARAAPQKQPRFENAEPSSALSVRALKVDTAEKLKLQKKLEAEAKKTQQEGERQRAQQAKKHEADQKKHAAKLHQIAGKAIAMMAHTITLGKSVEIHVRDANIALKLPAFITSEAMNELRAIELIDQSWKAVIAGGPEPTDDVCKIEKIAERCKNAKKSFEQVSAMIKVVQM